MVTPKKIQRYGRIPDLADQRDLQLRLGPPLPVAPEVSLRFKLPPVFEQSDLGSCTANAAVAAYWAAIADGVSRYVASRLFVYWWERYLNNSTRQDSGASIRDSITVLHKFGAPPETMWPYDIKRFKIKPSAAVNAAGLAHQCIDYLAVGQNASSFRQTLMAGFPILMGFTVYQSFESDEVARTGIVPLPRRNESVLGGHAVAIVGYSDRRQPSQRWELRNSWGTGWGDDGYFYMSDDYVLGALSSDFWAVKSNEG